MKGYARRVRNILAIVLVLNAAVAIGKLLAGVQANSLAVTGDGLHSSIDALGNVLALIVLRLATAPPDEDHPFGHGKYETISALLLSGLMLLTAFELGEAAVRRFIAPEEMHIGSLTLGVMVVTLAINAGVTHFEGRAGRASGSELLQADAAHTRSDVLVTLAVLGGLGLQALGMVGADSVLALCVAAFIAYGAYVVVRDVLPVLTDRVVYDAVDIARVVRSVPGVQNVHDIRSRGARRESYVQMHLVVDASDVAGAHAITDEVERRVSEELGVKEVFIHVEPEDDGSGPPGTSGEPASTMGKG
jgi:cation diffusion facilitator family transporter